MWLGDSLGRYRCSSPLGRERTPQRSCCGEGCAAQDGGAAVSLPKIQRVPSPLCTTLSAGPRLSRGCTHCLPRLWVRYGTNKSSPNESLGEVSLPGPLALHRCPLCAQSCCTAVAGTSPLCRAILHDRSRAIYGPAQMLCQRAGGGLIGGFLYREHNCRDSRRWMSGLSYSAKLEPSSF